MESLWKDDSGATDHCCKDKNLFVDFKECKIPLATAGKTTVVYAEGSGTIQYLANSGNLEKLTEVLYVPSLRNNLFSSTREVLKGGTHKITKEGSVLKNADHEILLKGTMNDTASIVIKMTHPRKRVELMNSTKDPNHWKKIHLRLGHRHISEYDHDCEFCLAIKTTRQKYQKYGTKDILKGRIFVDLMGPFGEDEGVKGYIALIVVDESDETICVILDKKSDFYNEWIPVAKRIEKAYDQKIKIFQCDGGGEFINAKMEKYFKENGIKLVQSNPYAHQQNGIVERRNRTIKESALTMCIAANMDFQKYWPSAFSCASYLFNLIKSTRTNVIPYEAKTGKKVKLEYLRPYGHIGFKHIPEERRKKNEIKGIKVRLLGYTSNGYFLEDSQGNHHYSRDVRWTKEDLSMALPADSDTDSETTSDEESDVLMDSEQTQVQDTDDFQTPNNSDGDSEEESEDDDEYSEDLNIKDRLRLEKQRSNIDPGNILKGKRN
jgi:hypothetical protein